MMSTAQHLLALFATTAVVGLGLFWSASEVGVQSVQFALGVNGFLLLWSVVVQRAARLSFGAWYYHSRPFEHTGRLYRRLGVHVFKRLMTTRLWRAFNPGFRYTGRQAGLAAWKRLPHGGGADRIQVDSNTGESGNCGIQLAVDAIRFVPGPTASRP